MTHTHAHAHPTHSCYYRTWPHIYPSCSRAAARTCHLSEKCPLITLRCVCYRSAGPTHPPPTCSTTTHFLEMNERRGRAESESVLIHNTPLPFRAPLQHQRLTWKLLSRLHSIAPVPLLSKLAPRTLSWHGVRPSPTSAVRVCYVSDIENEGSEGSSDPATTHTLASHSLRQQ